jgi:hypothetical protein
VGQARNELETARRLEKLPEASAEAYAADAAAELIHRGAAAGTVDVGRGGEAGAADEAVAPVPTDSSTDANVSPRSPSPARRGAPTKILVRVDLDTLLRGYPVGDEVCEIVGFGPVAVSAVRDMIDTGDPFLAAVVTRGVEVLGVAHLGRRPTAAQQTALQWLYPRCANEACSSLARLEYDHRQNWATSRVTAFEMLDRLCHHDHGLKTREGWSLVEGRGRRAFVPPDDSRHPRNTGQAERSPPSEAA